MRVEAAAMGKGRHKHARGMTPARVKTPVAALLSVFALLVQALLPAAALASDARLGAPMIICAADGVHTVGAGGAPAHHKGFAGLPCHDCLSATTATIATPEIAVTPVSYAVAHIVHTPVARRLTPKSRGPPRPHGQAPPSSNT